MTARQRTASSRRAAAASSAAAPLPMPYAREIAAIAARVDQGSKTRGDTLVHVGIAGVKVSYAAIAHAGQRPVVMNVSDPAVAWVNGQAVTHDDAQVGAAGLQQDQCLMIIATRITPPIAERIAGLIDARTLVGGDPNRRRPIVVVTLAAPDVAVDLLRAAGRTTTTFESVGLRAAVPTARRGVATVS